MAELISLRAYARHRGCNPMAVSLACKSGRLPKSTVRGPDGRVMGLTSIELADQEWLANTDAAKRPLSRNGVPVSAGPAAGVVDSIVENVGGETIESLPELSGDDLSVANASAHDKFWSAKKRELEYREAAGELVKVSEVEAKLAGLFTSCKTKLLAIPSRLRQALPHLTVADLAALEKLIREGLEELADGTDAR